MPNFKGPLRMASNNMVSYWEPITALNNKPRLKLGITDHT